jgi:hypothetical protein
MKFTLNMTLILPETQPAKTLQEYIISKIYPKSVGELFAFYYRPAHPVDVPSGWYLHSKYSTSDEFILGRYMIPPRNTLDKE